MNDSHVDCSRLSPNNRAMLSFGTKFNLPITHGAVVGSCGGLLCLAEEVRTSFKFYICNPITGEYVEIPGLEVQEGYEWPMGFYYSSQSKQCKILIHRYHKVGLIFTLGSNSWRNFNFPEFLTDHDLMRRSVLLDGAIHWIAAEDGRKDSYYICSFDMESEQVKTIAIPKEVNALCRLRLVVLGDSLCLDSFYELWKKEEYGAEESWRKHCINVEEIFNKIGYEVRPLAIKEDGSILMLDIYKYVLISYDTRTNKSKKNIEIEGNPYCLRAVRYTPSFVSLKDALNVGDQCWKVLNVRSKYCPNQPI